MLKSQCVFLFVYGWSSDGSVHQMVRHLKSPATTMQIVTNTYTRHGQASGTAGWKTLNISSIRETTHVTHPVISHECIASASTYCSPLTL